jgi:tripartite-type tricarboxylate transporter receptor subunit TctC
MIQHRNFAARLGAGAASIALGVAFGFSLGLGQAHAQTGDFYKGKTISIVVGIEQGTGFDLYGRALARHMGRHIPGNPTVIVSNMPGASGLIAFNWLANVAPKDGTTFGIGSFSVPFEPMFGNEAARFKGPQFGWVGNMDSGVSACLARTDSGIDTWKDVFQKELTVGAAGRGGAISQAPRALIELSGAKIKLIEGYVGTASIKLAIERNELQGICGISMSTVRSQWSDLLKSGLTKIVLQIGPKNDPELKGVPNAIDFARNDEERQIYNLIFGPQGLGRSFAAPPGVPAERLKTLRDAFSATMKDDAFLADASKSKLDISPQSGEEVQAFVEALYASPPDIIARAKKVLGR